MFDNITLEMSLKVFKQTNEDYIRHVCNCVFEQWHALLKKRKQISIMLWVGDGSELLDYSGTLSETFEWCRFVGTANLPALRPGEPTETSLHERKQDYMQQAPEMTYSVLRFIVRCLKEEARKWFPETVIRVGETFDIGPEFALSDFKYNRHREICGDDNVDGYGFIDVTTSLHQDKRVYVAYPTGIPEGEKFGTFLGKQAEKFLSDMDFDFLWLSNGVGFSSNPWNVTGKIYDGERYYPERLENTKRNVFEFWKLFRKECTFPIETRGTNNSVGIDYSSDGVPLYDIYRANLDITAPPNSPWAALNDDYGLELMGHMTRVCELPGEVFPFRYYIHDPWWVNSPWYDRYDGSPCDIYLPMSISRIDKDGKIKNANSLNILSIDNSYGDMPDACVNEPLPHLLKAEKDFADEPAPFVWIYPMREYTTSSDADMLREMNLGDHYICDAINDGFPLCCVVSTDNFMKHEVQTYKKSILITPVPESEELCQKLKEFLEEGIKIIFYGTANRLQTFQNFSGAIFLNVEDERNRLREAASLFGYVITFDKKQAEVKPPTMTVARRDGALLFSVYNCNTTTDTGFRFPYGAPILCGMEAEMKGGSSIYRFARSEHRECRVFITQENGIISCREAAPVNKKYRRAIRIKGLCDATVRLYSENNCECAVSINVLTDHTPQYDSRFSRVKDEVYGDYLYGEHIDGDIFFLIGKREIQKI